MSKYFIQGESVEAIADEVRELSGTNDLMGLTAIKSHVEEANSEINSQAELLGQIITALDGKAAGGGSGEDFGWLHLNTVEFPTFSTEVTAYK
jgi:hypothetical protein